MRSILTEKDAENSRRALSTFLDNAYDERDLNQSSKEYVYLYILEKLATRIEDLEYKLRTYDELVDDVRNLNKHAND